VPPAALAGHGDRVAAVVGRRWPDLVEELEGVAAGAGEDPRELLAINARTELLGGAGAGECSVLGHIEGDEPWLAQTWDWHPDLAGSAVIVSARVDGGPPFTTVTEAGILAKLGLNHAGVAVALNFLTCSLDGGLAGVPIHVLLRVLLDRCGGATEALGLLLGAQVSASSCVTVAVAEEHGAALFAVELSPGGAGVLWPEADGSLRHTNHFLAGPPAGQDTQPAAFPGTLLRLDHLRRRPLDVAALATHFPSGEPVCRHADDRDAWADRRATLLSVELEPRSRRLRLAAGPPCEAAFETIEPPS
jgi:isopenicillin-N N-acyltransferase-like protein